VTEGRTITRGHLPAGDLVPGGEVDRLDDQILVQDAIGFVQAIAESGGADETCQAAPTSSRKDLGRRTA
jgi:hypothetical protein